MANAMVNMDNFVILKSTTIIPPAELPYVSAGQVAAGDLMNLSFTSTMDYSATLNGTTSSDSANSTTGPGVDKPALCIGSGCVAPLTTDNAFGQKPGTPILGKGNYAAVDQIEVGSPVTGLSGYPQDHAHVANSAYVAIENGSGAASTESNNNLQASWRFTVASGITAMAFDFDVDAYLQVALDAIENAPTFATASYNIEFSLTCLDAVNTSCGLFGLSTVAFSPDLFSPAPGIAGPKSISLNAPLGSGLEQVFDTGGFVHINSGFIPVVAGKSLQLSARINTLADIERVVPEPGVLALLGLGLVGIGASLRRKAAS
jgi:hypothetical protein